MSADALVFSEFGHREGAPLSRRSKLYPRDRVVRCNRLRPVYNSYFRVGRDLGTVQRSRDDSGRALSVLLVTKTGESELTS